MKTLICFLTGALITSLAAQFPQSLLDIGRKQFEMNCGACHGADAQGGERGPSLINTRSTTFLLPSSADSSYHQLMPKRQGSSPAVKTKVELAEQEPGPTESVGTITTAIHIPRDTWSLLRAVAFHRAQNQGGRASVSKLVAELVERHRGELEREIK